MFVAVTILVPSDLPLPLPCLQPTIVTTSDTTPRQISASIPKRKDLIHVGRFLHSSLAQSFNIGSRNGRGSCLPVSSSDQQDD